MEFSSQKMSDLKEDDAQELSVYHLDIEAGEDVNSNFVLVADEENTDIEGDVVLVDGEDEELYAFEDYELSKVDITNGDKDSNTHTLCELEIIDETTQERFHCLECGINYTTIEKFFETHQYEREEIDIKSEQSEKELNDGNDVQQIEEVKNGNAIYLEEVIESEDENIKNENILDISNESVNTVTSFEKGMLYEIRDEDMCDNSSDRKYGCFECEQTFDDLDTANEHICFGKSKGPENYTYKSASEYFCPHCSMKLYGFPEFEEHLANCSKEYKCPVCDKSFKTFKSLSLHSRAHKEQQRAKPKFLNSGTPVVCDVCNTNFQSTKSLKLHMKIHNKRSQKTVEGAIPPEYKSEYKDMNLFYCEICNKSFDQKLLAIHKNMHQNRKEFTCKTCNRRFDNEANYEMHLKIHANKPHVKRAPQQRGKNSLKDMDFPCQYCDRVFPRPHEKVRHERIHTGEKPYECEVCGKTFRVCYSLTLHLRTHTNIRPYVCEICHKRFKSQPVYAHHQSTHSTECKYKCDICGKSYRSSVQLCTHKHTHNKPLKCTTCNRAFATLHAVNMHMKTHEKGAKPGSLKHSCTICGAAYARVFALRYHMLDDHGVGKSNKRKFEAQSADDYNDLHEDSEPMLSAAEVESSAEIEDEEDETVMATKQLAKCLNEGNDNVTDGIFNNEMNLENFQNEEIITDWMTNV